LGLAGGPRRVRSLPAEAAVDNERWRRLGALFDEARNLDGDNRAAFVAASCGGDDELRRELESLLAADRDAGGFLDEPAAAALGAELESAPPSPVGRRFGPYRVVAEIGRGGMGVVYRAVRDDDAFHKEVALKLLPGGALSDLFEERFRRERQILAGLEHPNIAHLLDGGSDDSGRPYYVLELVDGLPIDAYCRDRGLDLAARIELVRTACGAVALAHSRLVVHCDLKPANVLVTADGTVKLVDFGISRLLAPDADGGMAAATLTGWWMTPEYASPEQVRGEPVTTATDVYALGVMLYELLTGSRPYDVGSHSPDEVVRAICEREVTRPSLAVARPATGPSSARKTAPSAAGPADDNPRRLRRRLSGDLDTIVMRAMARDPASRYQSATELSEDLRRHLSGLPIKARPDRLASRVLKFLRRHRTGVAAAALVVASLCAGLVATIRQARIADAERAVAERRFDEVRRLAGTFIFQIDDEVAALPGATPVRKRIVEIGLEYLERLETEAAGDTGLLSEVAAAYERIASVQGGVGVANLGDLAGALHSQQRALELRDAVMRAAPENLTAALATARAHSAMADLLGANDDRDGRRRHLDASLEIRRDAARRAPADPAVRRAVASGMWAVAQLDVDDGDLAAGLAGFEAVLERYRELGESPTASDNDRRNLALAYKKVGAVRSASGDAEGALADLGSALAIDRTRLSANPDHPEALLDVAFDLGDLGYASLQLGRPRDAVARYEESVELRRRVAAGDPQDVRAQAVLRSGRLRLAAAIAAVVTTEAPSCTETRRLADRALALWTEVEAAGPLDAEATELRQNVAAAVARCTGGGQG